MVEKLLGGHGQVAMNDFVWIYLYSYMHRTFYTYRGWATKRKWLVWVVYIAALFALIGFNMLENGPLNLTATVGCYLIPLFLCYQVKSLRGIAYYAFFMVGIIALEIADLFIFGAFATGDVLTADYSSMTLAGTAIMTLLQIVLAQLICRYGNKDRDRRFDKITLMFMVMPILSSLILAIELFRNFQVGISAISIEQFYITAASLVLFNVAAFVVLEMYTDLMKKDLDLQQKEAQLRSDADVMALAAQAMQERLETAEAVTQQDRTMRHDRRHFEALLLTLLEADKTDEAKKCLEERLGQEPRAYIRYCENPTINAALTHYVHIAEHKKIRVEIQANIPEVLKVDDMQLAITISNLFENAIHGCLDVPEEERYIRLSAIFREQLLIEVENSCDGIVPLDEQGHPYTTREGHGTGTRSVLAFVRQTDSDIRYIAKENCFKVRMIV